MLLHTQTTQILSHLSGFGLGADCVVVDAVVVLMTGGDSCFLEVSVNDGWCRCRWWRFGIKMNASLVAMVTHMVNKCIFSN